ncbi:MAG: hypothetical protein QXU27_02115 [Candidatus Anstonellales archaeon]
MYKLISSIFLITEYIIIKNDIGTKRDIKLPKTDDNTPALAIIGTVQPKQDIPEARVAVKGTDNLALVELHVLNIIYIPIAIGIIS